MLPPLKTPAARSAEVKSVCVFCGSGPGKDPAYMQDALELGKALAEQNIELIYGGGSVGIMGQVAKSVIDHGGRARGIVPEPLFRHGSKQIAETVIVPDMHTRKRTMGDLSDAFIALPGGYGTMEELLEIITWSQLNIHSKPILVLNTKGYYDLFVQWIDHSIQENFVKPENKAIFKVCETVKDLMDALKSYEAPNSRFGLDWVKTDGAADGTSPMNGRDYI